MRSLYESILDSDSQITKNAKKNTDLIKIIDIFLKFANVLKLFFRGIRVDYRKDSEHTLYRLVYNIDSNQLCTFFTSIKNELVKASKDTDYEIDGNKAFPYLSVTQKSYNILRLQIFTNRAGSLLVFKGSHDKLEFIKNYINTKLKK